MCSKFSSHFPWPFHFFPLLQFFTKVRHLFPSLVTREIPLLPSYPLVTAEAQTLLGSQKVAVRILQYGVLLSEQDSLLVTQKGQCNWFLFLWFRTSKPCASLIEFGQPGSLLCSPVLCKLRRRQRFMALVRKGDYMRLTWTTTHCRNGNSVQVPSVVQLILFSSCHHGHLARTAYIKYRCTRQCVNPSCTDKS